MNRCFLKIQRSCHTFTRIGTIGGGMINYSQISEALARYLNGKIDLDSFEDWFVVNSWNIHLANDPQAESLVFAIEESLAEYSSEHITELQMQAELRALLLSAPRATYVELSSILLPFIWAPVGLAVWPLMRSASL
jgi:hypothetical protein